MSTTGAMTAAGIAIAFLALAGALMTFALAMATLETYGPERARPAFITLAALALTFIAGVTLIGAAQ